MAGFRRLMATKRITQTQVARAAGLPPASINRMLSGKQRITLEVLDVASGLIGADPLDLLIDPIDLRMRVSPREQALVNYLRSLPSTTLEALLDFLDYYIDEAPATRQLRDAHEHLRHLKDGPRQRAVAYLLFLREGGLTPDLQAAFGLPVTDESADKEGRGPRLLKGRHGPKK